MVPNRRLVDRSGNQIVPPDQEPSLLELSDEWRAELLDPHTWVEVLKTYAATTKLAVALTDARGHLLGECLNPQPVWSMAHQSARESESVCPFCLAPPAPCSAVVDALRTGAVVMTQDGAGLAHVAVPLSLGGRRWGALIAGQVFNRYPEPLHYRVFLSGGAATHPRCLDGPNQGQGGLRNQLQPSFLPLHSTAITRSDRRRPEASRRGSHAVAPGGMRRGLQSALWPLPVVAMAASKICGLSPTRSFACC